MTDESEGTGRPATGLELALEGWNRAWVARHLDPPVSPSAITRWAKGEWPVPETRIPELARLLRVTEEAIRDGVRVSRPQRRRRKEGNGADS